MQLERVRPGVFRITAHAYEMAALIAAARWVAEGAQGELAEEAIEQLRQVLANYDDGLRRLDTRTSGDGSGDDASSPESGPAPGSQPGP